jgi:hypothetical protein
VLHRAAEGRGIDDPLFLQIKEAEASVLEPYAGKSVYANDGQRPRRTSSSAGSEVSRAETFTGGSSIISRDLYLWKTVAPEGLNVYARFCGQTLARAHGRSGDSVQIAAYLAASTRFDQAIASFAEHYADQTEEDYQQLVSSYRTGRVLALLGK